MEKARLLKSFNIALSEYRAFFMANETQISNEPTPSVQYKNRSNNGKLNDIYQARIRLCDKKGAGIDDEQVVAIATDGDLTIEGQYSTPFENSNPEHRLPTLMGMLQSGDWVTTLDSVAGAFGISLSDDKKSSLNTLEGRSNLTKVNSTQIFVNSSVQLSMTLVFSAWEDAKVEVEDQISLLQKWALPQELSEGSLVSSVVEGMSLESLFPSLVPPYVSIHYGNKRYLPLLIQHVSTPLVVPMDKDGNRMSIQVSVTFLSRTAWDANDINNLY